MRDLFWGAMLLLAFLVSAAVVVNLGEKQQCKSHGEVVQREVKHETSRCYEKHADGWSLVYFGRR